MTQTVKAVAGGIGALFTGKMPGGASDEDRQRAEQQLQQQREGQILSLTRQQQQEQNEADRQEQQLGGARRVPRGRRLLLASTGEAGLSDKLG